MEAEFSILSPFHKKDLGTSGQELRKNTYQILLALSNYLVDFAIVFLRISSIIKIISFL